MTLNLQETALKFESYSFVGIWEREIAISPIFFSDKDYCESFFEGEKNIVAQSDEGKVILNPKQDRYNILVGPNKIVISADSKEGLCKYYEKFVNKISEDYVYKDFAKISQFGLNLSIRIPVEGSALRFLANKYLKDSISPAVENIEYRLLLEDGYLYVKVVAVGDSALGILTDYHRDLSSELISVRDMDSGFDTAIEKTKNLVTDFLKK